MKQITIQPKPLHLQQLYQVALNFLVALVLCTTNLIAQSNTSTFTFVSPYIGLSVDQTKIVNYATNQPHIGSVQYISWASGNLLNSNGEISTTLPGENSGLPILFEVNNSHFSSASEYALFGRSAIGEIAIYTTPEGRGGSITLLNSTYVLYPLGDTKGVLIKTDTSLGGTCATDPTLLEEAGYCEDDCGSDVIDVLAMVTPEAQQWLDDNFGVFGLWWLTVETHNINGAFSDSNIPNKWVRVHTISYTPDFSLSQIIGNDLASLSANPNAKQILEQKGCDVGILVTNQNYGNSFGIANSSNPASNNKFCIAQVAYIDPIRYTFAHELAHQFGCQHHNVTNVPGCPQAKQLTSGKNTIMVGGAQSNTRIRHFSNPDIFFGSEPTGNSAFRNNAAQIRGAFCEVANNNPPAWFSVDFTQGMIASDCAFTASATIQPGLMYIFGNEQECGTNYTYQWSWSTDNVVYSNVGINSPTLNLPVVPNCPFFYLRATVNTPNGCSASVTKLLFCSNLACSRGVRERFAEYDASVPERNRAYPNPAQNQFSILLDDFLTVESVKASSPNSSTVQILPVVSFEQGLLICNVSNLNNGIWFTETLGGDKLYVLKLIVMR